MVDQAARHAEKLAKAISRAHEDSVVGAVRSSLLALSASGNGSRAAGEGDEEVLPLCTMRGGVTWDAAWLSRPDLPAIVTGTVDQIGSRFLFRGYNVSPRRWPIDAALVGNDSLILIDEAHLASAMVDSVASALEQDRSFIDSGLPSPALIQLSATGVKPATGWTYKFKAEDNLANPEAAHRLRAPKTLTRVEAPAKKVTKVLAETAASKVDQDQNARVLVVCNTIDRAREVHQALSRTLKDVEPSLLIGRSRPIDRSPIVERVLGDLGPERSQGGSPSAVVATQTVEVGIDLDATDLVTECASWDALVQRLGRVNRRGRHPRSTAVVVTDDNADPPVYGQAQVATRDYLTGLGVDSTQSIDVSPMALRELTPDRSAFMAQPPAPLLLPSHLDAWTRTAPAPLNDAPLDPFLHGIGKTNTSVVLTWRDGLRDSADKLIDQELASSLLDAVPPRAEESIEVPLAAARRWLAQEKRQPVADIDIDDDWEVPFADDSKPLVFRRLVDPDAEHTWGEVWAREIAPGDQLVVPSDLGGLDQFGWNPSCKDKVHDVSEIAALERGAPLLLLTRGIEERLGLAAPSEDVWHQIDAFHRAVEPEDQDELTGTVIKAFLDWLSEEETSEGGLWAQEDRLQRLRVSLAEGAVLHRSASKRSRGLGGPGLSALTPLVLRGASRVSWQQANDENADGSVHLGSRKGRGPVTLTQHHQAVGQRAREIATNLGIDDDTCQVLFDAARWHDMGKLDPRFQAMLFYGDRIAADLAPEPLAKSGMPPGSLEVHREARLRSGLPARARHEAWSAALVESYLEDFHYEGDGQLAAHLVASHHGHARPLLPIVYDQGDHQLEGEIDGHAVTAQLPRGPDVNLADRFASLNERYGRWRLAMLETVVRSADMTVSGEGS